MEIKICYFAWVREKTGLDQEIIMLDDATYKIQDVVDHLAQKSSAYSELFSDFSGLQVACNQTFTTLDADIKSGDEIAIFPPVTGGD